MSASKASPVDVNATVTAEETSPEQPNDIQASVLEILKAKLPTIPAEGMIVLVPLADIILSADSQVRDREDQEWINTLAVRYGLGIQIPEPNVFAGLSADNRLSLFGGDGRHRIPP